MSGRIELIDLVENDRIGLERAKAMGKAGGNEELLVPLTAQLDGNMPAEARRRTAKIDSYIENPPAQHTNQLRLSERRPLKVQAANGSRPIGARLIVLEKIVVEPLRGKVRSLERLAKVSSGVGKSRCSDQFDIWNCQRMYVHLHLHSPAVDAQKAPVVGTEGLGNFRQQIHRQASV